MVGTSVINYSTTLMEGDMVSDDWPANGLNWRPNVLCCDFGTEAKPDICFLVFSSLTDDLGKRTAVALPTVCWKTKGKLQDTQ